MDDKLELAALMQRIAGSLEGIDKCVNEIADALQTMRNRAESEVKQRVAQLNAISAAPKYMGGRWPRRDGDGLGTVRPTFDQLREASKADNVSQPSGDGSSGNL